MNIVRPIVNISKIADGYDTFLVGFRGVLFDGLAVYQEALEALKKMKENHKNVILVSNTSMRVASLMNMLEDNGLPYNIWNGVVTSGEILHYKLKAKKGEFAGLGKKFYSVGSKKHKDVFAGLDYEEVEDITKADFLYMSEAISPMDTIEDYIAVLEYGANLSLPLVCVGNDTANYVEGEVALSSGTVAEQYAIMGGKIITSGKPDPRVIAYSLESFENLDKSKILMIGDSLSTDVKGAELAGVDSVLISKGVHVNFLGEGYIPDVAKTNELANNFEAYPVFVISSLRW